MAKKKKQKNKGSVIGDGGAQPYWAPLERMRLTRWQQASIVVRNLVPLICLAWFGGSIMQFMLLTVFNLAFTIAGIATVGAAVSTRQEVQSTGLADQIGALLTLVLLCAGVSLLLTALFGWFFAVIASYENEGLWNATLWWGVLAIVVGAVPAMVMQYGEDLRAKLPEDARKQRDQPVIGVHLFCAFLIVVLAGWTLDWGYAGSVALAIAVTALFIFRDLRPDLARELMRPNPVA
jgi:hypothetical protein